MVRTLGPQGFPRIEVSEREDLTLHNLNGQHRVAAYRLAGWEGDVAADVYRGLSLEDEAFLFRWLNLGDKPGPLADLRIAIVQGEGEALHIEGLLQRHGFHLAGTAGGGGVSAAAALRRSIRLRHEGHPPGWPLGMALTVIRGAWGDDGVGVHGDLIAGLAMVFARDGQLVDVEALVHKLAAHTGGAAGFLGRARGYKGIRPWATYKCAAQAAIDVHNANKRTRRLADW
jgi:hypothetical protein